MNGHSGTNFLRPTISVVHQTRRFFSKRGGTYSKDNIDNTLCPRYPDSPVNGVTTSVLVNGTPRYPDKMPF